MKDRAFLPLRIEAERFLQQNGIVWIDCEVESVPDDSGHITLFPAVCLCKDLLLGATSRILGLMCAHGSGMLYTAEQTIYFPMIDPVHAARELLLGDFEAYFTTERLPLALDWTPEFQERLRHHLGPALASHALRSELLHRIADAEGQSDEDLRY